MQERGEEVLGWPISHPSCIYAIRCKETGKVYIGRTYRLEARIKEHFAELRFGGGLNLVDLISWKQQGGDSNKDRT